MTEPIDDEIELTPGQFAFSNAIRHGAYSLACLAAGEVRAATLHVRAGALYSAEAILLRIVGIR